MQSDPQDEQSKLPASRDGEPQEPVGDDANVPSSEPPEAAPPTVAPRSTTPPRMPAPPQMPPGGPPPSAWGSPPGTSSAAPAAPADAAIDGGGPTDDPGAESGSIVADQAGGQAPAPPTETTPALGVVRPSAMAGVAPVAQGDWLASVCPYLTSEDGTYRSAAPSDGHRCTAQHPAATLPLAFQERFCLTDRHPRCEMYKFAQETDSAGGIPAASIPPTDPPTPRTRRVGAGGPGRPLLATIAGIGGLLVVVLLVSIFMGSCGGGDAGNVTDPDLVRDEQATQAPAATPTPSPTPTPEAVESPEPDVSGDTVRILYEIQPDEALRRISETFGITRNRIRRENPGLDEVSNAEMVGMIIELPIVGDMTLADAEALPGFVGLVSELEAEAAVGA